MLNDAAPQAATFSADATARAATGPDGATRAPAFMCDGRVSQMNAGPSRPC